MNTFLPSGDFKQVARTLDHVRLSRQISECVMVAKLCRSYNLLLDTHDKLPWGISLHPVHRLWIVDGRCSLGALFNYTETLHYEYKCRTAKDHESFAGTNWDRFLDSSDALSKKIEWPEIVHESHRAKLLGKDSSHYYKEFMREGLSIPGELEYEWLSPREV